MSSPTERTRPNPWRRLQNRLEQGVGHQQQQNQVLQQSPIWMRGITVGLSATALFGLAWLALAQTEEIVVAPGKLEPVGRVKDIQVPVGGVVSDLLVKEGQRVQAGQVLLKLDTEASADRQRSLLETIRLKETQLALKQQELARYNQLNSSQQVTLERNLSLQTDIQSKLDRLAREGASAELQLLQQKDKVQQVQGELDQARIERRRQEAQQGQATQLLRSELSDLRTKLTELNVNLRYQEVRSPVSGVVFELKPRGRGFVAQTSEPLLKIVPFDKLEARVEIPSTDVGFVWAGQAVDLSIDSFPATDFGVLEGTVRRIGSDALPPDQAKGRTDYRFPADIQLKSQQLKLKNGKLLPLQVGMSLTANIKLRKVSYLQLLLGEFKNKADSLRRS
jgi:hemolysin D